MKKVILLLLIFTTIQTGFAQTKRTLTLEEVIALAKQNSRSSNSAKASLIFGYWSYRVFNSTLNPQLSLTGTLPAWNRSFTQITQNNGDILFIDVNQNNSDLGLSFQQVIAATNTTISLNSSLNRFDDFELDNTRWRGVPASLSIRQPLFDVNNFKWGKKIRPLIYEESKREYAETQETISRQAATFFFRLLEEQINLQIALQNVSKNDTIFNIEQGRYNIGTTTEDQLLQTELDLLNARSNAQQATLDVQTRTLDLRNFIGLQDDVEIELVAPEDIPVLNIDPDEALKYAKEYRAQYLSFDRQRLEADQNVANARAQRFSADLFASVGVNGQNDSFSNLYDNLNNQSVVRLGFNLPILDGGRNKARMGQALAQKQVTEFNIEQSLVTFEQEVQTAVRNFDQIRNQIEISKKGEEIALKRFDITNNRYLIGKVDILTLTNARSAKDQAIRTYISSLRQYWEAYYELRSLTLYDFLRGEQLYNPLLEYDPSTDSIVEKLKGN